MRRVVPVVVFTAIAAGLIAPTGQASLYQPEDPLGVPVGPDGIGRELEFERQFKSRLITAMNERNPGLKDLAGKNTARETVLKRVAERQKKINRTPAENTALAADLLRLGDVEQAEAAVSRDRQGFLTNMTLAHIYGEKGQWAKASEYLSIAAEDPLPANVKELTGPQFEWEQKINRGPLAKLYESRGQELRSKLAPENEDLDPIFEVKFVNEAGKYEPGRLAEAERKKLPPDAIAIVQQMVLWSPTDARLYWQLGELYAAQGKFIEAKKILDECVSEARHYSNHKILMEHRAVIMPLAESQAKQRSDSDASDDPPPSQPAVPIDLGTVWIYFGIVAAVVLLAVVRAVIRKPRSMRGISR